MSDSMEHSAQKPNAVAPQRARQVIDWANKGVNLLVLTIVVAAVAIAISALTDINLAVVNGSPEQYALYKPGEDKKSFEELQAINPEVIGWIQVYGTKVDYPVVQAKNNEKYLSYGPDLKYSLLGSIFMDYTNKPDFSDFNSVLYGHNMTPRAMFGNIKDFKDKAYFDAHKYGDLFFNDGKGYKHHGLEIFAVYEGDGYSEFVRKTQFASDADKQSYLDEIFKRALLSRKINVSISDHLVTMYTCSNALTNGRELLVARITDRTFEDTFAEEDSGLKNPFDALLRFPLWIWPFLLLAVLLLILYWIKRSEKKRAEAAEAAKAEASAGEEGAAAEAEAEQAETEAEAPSLADVEAPATEAHGEGDSL